MKLRRIPFAALPSLLLLSAGCGPSTEVASPAVPAPTATPSAAAQAASSAPIDDALPKSKLPADVRSLASTVELTVVPEEDRFSGKVDIDVELASPRAVVWMHGGNFDVKSVTITPAGGKPIAAEWKLANKDGVVSLRPTTTVPAGKATIHVEYSAPWGKGMRGLYKAKEAGLSYAFTQFEAIDARDAFPSFDEPRFKIPFTVILNVKKEHTAVANTREVSRTDIGNGMVSVRFAPTKPIPSYLVAFAAGPLDIVDGPAVPPNETRKEPLPLRVVTAKGRGKDAAYALKHTGEFVTLLEKYTGIAHPYEKLDILAVPERSGAMENPGAITFMENMLLFDEKTVSSAQKRSYAGVMAHELAHQWFGDLVTTAWWDDIWLNEAFATWLGTRTEQAWDPTTEADLDLADDVERTMSVDSLETTRRIREPIETVHDIENAFDSITYEKGAGVLGMFERWLGAPTFQKGVRTYLTKHAYKTTTADDFLAAMSEAAGKDVATPFRTFLDQPGVPLVDATLRCDDKGTARAAVSVKQSRFYPLGVSAKAKQAAESQKWSTPVCVKYASGKGSAERCGVVDGSEGAFELEGSACPAWFLPNAEASGYYRFVSDPAALGKLQGAGASFLTPRDKVALASGLRAGFQRGATPAKDVYGALPFFTTEDRSTVLLAPEGYLSLARNWLAGKPEEAKVAKYARTLYGPALKRLGTTSKGTSEPIDRGVARQGVAHAMADIGLDPALRKDLGAKGRAYVGYGKDDKTHPEAVDANLSALALTVAVQDGDAKLWDALSAKLATSEDAELRRRILRALGSTKDPILAKRARELSLDGRLRNQEITTALGAQMSMPETREATWVWLKDNFDKLSSRLSDRHAGSMAHLAQNFCDEDHAKEVEAFFGPKADGWMGGPRVVAQTVESIRTCSARRAAQEEGVRTFFRSVK